MLIKQLNAAIRDKNIDEQIRIAKMIAKEGSRYPESLVTKALLIIEQHSAANLECHDNDMELDEQTIIDISNTKYFDKTFYESDTGKVFGSNKLACIHYLTTGWRAGKNPSIEFNTQFYLASNPDVRKHSGNPLVHYVYQGISEGREPVPPQFDEDSQEQKYYDSLHVGWHRSWLPLWSLDLRVICFYLPQFHCIPENDTWWGKGFTEWTNVKKAEPLFPGHRQPKMPGELGYYDLSEASTLRRQAKIASAYGVTGFCFYFYWFAGKTLLEKPLQNLLDNPDIAIEFSLCWANENWTRTWDGLENDILIAQSHSPEDDICFISHIKKYLLDPRYLRIDGKPLITVYRPSLLPDPAGTANRWREWCRQNGIGEIIIALTHSFDNITPDSICFDLAIEFAPNNMNLRKHDPSSIGCSNNFEGNIYDWSSLLERSNPYKKTDYPLLRCINPGWDNSPRKKNRASILIHNTPRSFLRLAENAIIETLDDSKTPNILFVNAWNEWAEGAILEPTASRGYAYLSALRQAQANTLPKFRSVCKKTLTSPRYALLIHAFYPEILSQLLTDLSGNSTGIEFSLIIVTTILEKQIECEQILVEFGFMNSIVIATQNRGRDIGPFVESLELIARSNIDFVCKLHTKKSKHRQDGDSWRNEIIKGLCHSSALSLLQDCNTLGSFDIGLLAPKDHLLPVGTYWGSNQHHVLSLGTKLGLSAEEISSSYFPAGSMYWFRVDALLPLLSLVDPDKFEFEVGQTDGTYAHAIERVIGMVVSKSGYLSYELDPVSSSGFNDATATTKLFKYNN